MTDLSVDTLLAFDDPALAKLMAAESLTMSERTDMVLALNKAINRAEGETDRHFLKRMLPKVTLQKSNDLMCGVIRRISKKYNVNLDLHRMMIVHRLRALEIVTKPSMTLVEARPELPHPEPAPILAVPPTELTPVTAPDRMYRMCDKCGTPFSDDAGSNEMLSSFKRHQKNCPGSSLPLKLFKFNTPPRASE